MTIDEPPGPGAVTVSARQLNTVLTALYEAAGYRQNRAAICTDCMDQSCPTCQWRLESADAYAQLATELIEASEASATRQPAPGRAEPASSGPHPAADPEAGQ